MALIAIHGSYPNSLNPQWSISKLHIFKWHYLIICGWRVSYFTIVCQSVFVTIDRRAATAYKKRMIRFIYIFSYIDLFFSRNFLIFISNIQLFVSTLIFSLSLFDYRPIEFSFRKMCFSLIILHFIYNLATKNNVAFLLYIYFIRVLSIFHGVSGFRRSYNLRKQKTPYYSFWLMDEARILLISRPYYIIIIIIINIIHLSRIQSSRRRCSKA